MTTATDYLIKVLADTSKADSKLKTFSKNSALLGAGLAAAGTGTTHGNDQVIPGEAFFSQGFFYL